MRKWVSFYIHSKRTNFDWFCPVKMIGQSHVTKHWHLCCKVILLVWTKLYLNCLVNSSSIITKTSHLSQTSSKAFIIAEPGFLKMVGFVWPIKTQKRDTTEHVVLHTCEVLSHGKGRRMINVWFLHHMGSMNVSLKVFRGKCSFFLLFVSWKMLTAHMLISIIICIPDRKCKG